MLMLAVVIAAATVVALWWVPRASTRPSPTSGWMRHPGTWLIVVIGLMLANQVLFTAYAVQAWQGDVGQIARYLPSGWFDLADLGDVASSLPAWSWTVLRVQAALELPFVLLAYLLVCRWFGAETFRRAVSARWWVSASYTVTFCLIEWDLYNPYTVEDIVIRLVAGVVTPLLVPLLSEGAARGPGLVAFVASTGALGCVVLAVYDVATLYNLAHLTSWLPLVSVALVVLGVARWWARRSVRHGPALTSAARSLGWFLTLFLVPALPLRYGLNFGVPVVSLLAGTVVVAGALWLGWDRRHLGLLAVAGGAGVLGAIVGYFLARGYPEARLLAAAGGFVLAGAAACAAHDRGLGSPRGGRTRHLS